MSKYWNELLRHWRSGFGVRYTHYCIVSYRIAVHLPQFLHQKNSFFWKSSSWKFVRGSYCIFPCWLRHCITLHGLTDGSTGRLLSTSFFFYVGVSFCCLPRRRRPHINSVLASISSKETLRRRQCRWWQTSDGVLEKDQRTMTPKVVWEDHSTFVLFQNISIYSICLLQNRSQRHFFQKALVCSVFRLCQYQTLT